MRNLVVIIITLAVAAYAPAATAAASKEENIGAGSGIVIAVAKKVRSSSRPSILGISQSRMISSGRFSWTNGSASSPLPAVKTVRFS